MRMWLGEFKGHSCLPNSYGNRGFSLIEAVVSLAISGLITAAGIQVASKLGRSAETSSAAIEAEQEFLPTLKFLEEDLQSIAYLYGRTTTTAFFSDQKIAGVQRYPNHTPTGEENSDGIQLVSYIYRAGSNAIFEVASIDRGSSTSTVVVGGDFRAYQNDQVVMTTGGAERELFEISFVTFSGGQSTIVLEGDVGAAFESASQQASETVLVVPAAITIYKIGDGAQTTGLYKNMNGGDFELVSAAVVEMEVTYSLTAREEDPQYAHCQDVSSRWVDPNAAASECQISDVERVSIRLETANGTEHEVSSRILRPGIEEIL